MPESTTRFFASLGMTARAASVDGSRVITSSPCITPFFSNKRVHQLDPASFTIPPVSGRQWHSMSEGGCGRHASPATAFSVTVWRHKVAKKSAPAIEARAKWIASIGKMPLVSSDSANCSTPGVSSTYSFARVKMAAISVSASRCQLAPSPLSSLPGVPGPTYRRDAMIQFPHVLGLS